MGIVVLAEIKSEYHDKKLFRGERNNNPGNLVNTPEIWQGEIVDGDDERFMQFTSATYGIRALGKLLLNYQSKYGIKTVRTIISRWAPKFENNTEAYASFVSKHIGVGLDESIDVKTYLYKLVEAIILVECDHRIIYTDETMRSGILLALGKKDITVPTADSGIKSTAAFLFCAEVAAYNKAKDGASGYAVDFGGTVVWLPSGVFERQALYLNDKSGTVITPCEIASIIDERKTVKLGTALVTHVRLKSAFNMAAMAPMQSVDESSELECVEDANHRAEMQLREYLEFLLAWGINGIN